MPFGRLLTARLGERYRRVQALRGRTDITLSDVDTAATAGEEWTLGLWVETATLLAVALGNAIALLNPALLGDGAGIVGAAHLAAR